MADSYEKRDTLPLWWFGRVPVYGTSILVLLVLFGMFATVLLMSAQVSVVPLMFVPQLFWKEWYLWEAFTYPFIKVPDFFAIFGLFFLYSFGVGVESHFGRRIFTRIVIALILVCPVISSLWWLGGSQYAMVSGCSGSLLLSIGIFVSFATLYPNVEFWNWITMKWLAFAGIVLCAMSYLPARDWYGLSLLLSTCGAAYALVRYEKGDLEIPTIRLPQRKPNLRVLPKPSSGPRPMPKVEMAETPEDAEVDRLLDKIAKSGLASLSAGERARLEKAREELLKKERR